MRTVGGGMDGLQRPFDAAVVMATVLRPSLERAVESVFAQDVAGRVQVLIGIDTPVAGAAERLAALGAACPDGWAVTVVDPGYSTSLRHGGLHAAYGGGALRTVLSYLANSRHVAYLDDDNWWRADHLSSLLGAIAGADWAFGRRWFVDPRTLGPLCVDAWESVGPGKGIFAQTAGGFVDTNSLMIDKIRCEPVLRCWSIPFATPNNEAGKGEDRTVFAALRSFTGAATGRPTTFYVPNPADILAPIRDRLILESVVRDYTFRRGVAVSDAAPWQPRVRFRR